MYSRKEKCGLLSQDPTLHGFFNVLCADREALAACWLENDEEKKMTFGELCSAVNCCAAVISHIGCGKQGGWVGLAVETCRWICLRISSRAVKLSVRNSRGANANAGVVVKSGAT